MLWHFSGNLIMSRSENARLIIAKEDSSRPNAGEDMGVNLEKPTLIYSRSKGEYKAELIIWKLAIGIFS